MDWINVIENVLTFTFASAIIGFLIRSLIKRFIDKDIERFKYELKQSQFRFSRLHEKRMKIIEELYEKLANLEIKMTSLISPLQLAGDLPIEDKLKEAAGAGNLFSDFYARSKIYFDKKICDLIYKINIEFKKAWNEFTLFPPKSEWSKEKSEFWQKAWNRVSGDIPKLKEELENEFRSILDVKANLESK